MQTARQASCRARGRWRTDPRGASRERWMRMRVSEGHKFKCQRDKVNVMTASRKPTDTPEMNQGTMELPQWMGQDNDQDRLWAVETASKIALIHLPLMNLEMKDEESFLLRHFKKNIIKLICMYIYVYIRIYYLFFTVYVYIHCELIECRHSSIQL